MIDFKAQLIHLVKTQLNEKLDSLQKMINELSESSNNETKSSVGDKHETAKAMMQLEQEKMGNQLKDIEHQLKDFNSIVFQETYLSITNGCLIETSKGLFFIATALGKIELQSKLIYVISNKSPLGLKLLGAKIKDAVDFNGIQYIIKTIN